MIAALYATGGAIAAFYVLWIIYLAVMNLKRVRDMGKLSPLALYLGTPLLFVGYILDALLNWIVMTVILLELPQETTVSERLKRHNKESDNWRKSVALWFEPLLDPFDPSGDHI
jgi:uncharacterized membrane protein YhaH (DUF805 family)